MGAKIYGSTVTMIVQLKS